MIFPNNDKKPSSAENTKGRNDDNERRIRKKTVWRPELTEEERGRAESAEPKHAITRACTLSQASGRRGGRGGREMERAT